MDENSMGPLGSKSQTRRQDLKTATQALTSNAIKAGEVVGWRTELERQAAAAGEAWERYQTVS